MREATLTIQFPSNLRAIARALDGDVGGGQVLGPGPGHGARDRSLSVRLSATAPDGFLAFSHAGDDFAACRDHVRERLGLDRNGWKRERPAAPKRPAPAPADDGDDRGKKIADAIALWRDSVDPRGTVVQAYLKSRVLALDDEVAGSVIRWNPRIGAMIALFRNIDTDEPQAVNRIFLDHEGRKLKRMFLGPVGGAAIKLDATEEVTRGLHIGEGVETCMASRQIGLRPAWALGSAGAIAAFPVLAGIEALTLLRERDDANARAADQVTLRWQAETREVFDAWPHIGKDVNDALKGGAS
jgi:putative DNA primase/helicase